MQPLEGIKVIDTEGSISTAYCAKLFADQGASVVNLEPETGFVTRCMGPFVSDLSPLENSALHAFLNTNKFSVSLADANPSMLDDLFSRADLVLDGGTFSSDIGDKVGGENIRMSISWYGESGPYRDFEGSDAQIFALNGMLRNIGPEEGPPQIPSGFQTQIIGGMTAYIGSLGHLVGHAREVEKTAQRLHTSIFEAALCFTEVNAVSFFDNQISVPRLGINRFPPTFPFGIYACADGWLGVTVLTPAQWRSFCELIDLGDFAEIPLFESSVERFMSIDVIEPVMVEKLANSTVGDLVERGQAKRIPLAPVPTMSELVSTQHSVARQAFKKASLTNGSQLTIPSVPFRLTRTPEKTDAIVARLGEHSLGVVL